MSVSDLAGRARGFIENLTGRQRIDFRKGQWERHGLPPRIDGQSFLDVGCWEGLVCLEALSRGASPVLGIDYCTCPDLLESMKEGDFSFIQLDIFSEKLLELPEFDVVHCAGVLYHVENPLSLLFRLRKLCRIGGLVCLESTWAITQGDEPLMIFHPGASCDENPSNWWTPNEPCLHEMLRAAGFSEIETTYRHEPMTATATPIGRIAVRAHASSTPASIPLKLLPRRPRYMPSGAASGNRFGVKP